MVLICFVIFLVGEAVFLTSYLLLRTTKLKVDKQMCYWQHTTRQN